MKAKAVVAAVVASSFALVWGCSTTEVRLGVQAPDPLPSFVAADAGTELEASVDTLIAYCPSNQCPSGLTTCPTSQFPCDVNLKTDQKNCGSCGFACPEKAIGGGFVCVEGSCVIRCSSTSPPTLDCDGLVDNGCEVTLGTNENCYACGDKCLDPANPCVTRGGSSTCGCGKGSLYCPEPYRHCVDHPDEDDKNCGACNIACDPAGDGGARPPHTYYGCVEGQCGRLKCQLNYGDCDFDISNGCETSLFSSKNCAACGMACDPGQDCLLNLNNLPQCMCPAGQTYCGGQCVDLATDPFNCGDCGFACARTMSHSFGVCTYGSCGIRCVEGWGECNGDPSDDCEINLNSDPRNCGACGNVCDAIAGQACVGGQCVVEPCVRDAGDVR